MGCTCCAATCAKPVELAENEQDWRGPGLADGSVKDDFLVVCIYETLEAGKVFLSGDTSADLLEELYKTLAGDNHRVLQLDAEEFSPGCRWNIVFTGTKFCYGGPSLVPNGKKFNRMLATFMQAGWIPQASMQINGIGDDAGSPQQHSSRHPINPLGGRSRRKTHNTQPILVFERRSQPNQKTVLDGETKPAEGSVFLAVKDNGKGNICAAGPESIISTLKTTFVERLKKYCPGISCDFNKEDTEEAWDCVWQGAPVTWLMGYEPHLDDEAKALQTFHPMKDTRFPIGQVYLAIIEEMYNLKWKLLTSPTIGGWTCFIFTPSESLRQRPVCLTAIQEFKGVSKLCIAGARSDAIAHLMLDSLQSNYDPDKSCQGRPCLQKYEDDDWVQVIRNAPLTTISERTYAVQSDTFMQLLRTMTSVGWKPVACPNFCGIGRKSWPTIVWEYDASQCGLNVALMAFSSASVEKLFLHGDLVAQEMHEALGTQTMGTKDSQNGTILGESDMELPNALTSKARDVPLGHNLRMICAQLFKQGLHAAGTLTFLRDGDSCSAAIFIGGLAGRDLDTQGTKAQAVNMMHFFEGDWRDDDEKALLKIVLGREANLFRVFMTSGSTVLDTTQEEGNLWFSGQELHANGAPLRGIRICQSEHDTLRRQIYQQGAWSTPNTALRYTTADYEAQGKYVTMHTLWKALEKKNTVLIKGSWLINWYKSGAILPRRQDLPDGAAWDNSELRQMVEKQDVFVAAMSYAWSAPDHPDASGKQLETLAKILEMRLKVEYKTGSGIGYQVYLDAAVFLDWSSLYQVERNSDEKKSFQLGLLHCNLWYAHEATESWLFTQVQPGVRPYLERGWPSFEKAIASMTTPDHMLFDAGKFDSKTMKEWSEFYTACKAGRDPPKVPEEFNAELAEKHFTNGADLSMVQDKYSSTFKKIMSSVLELSFSNLDWNDSEAMTLAKALCKCVECQKMDLKSNTIGPDGAVAIIKAAKDCPSLEIISLTANPMGGTGLSAIAPHLPYLKALKTMWLNECRITDEGVLHMCATLHLCTSIQNFYLFDNEITNVGCEALCDVFPKCLFLVQFGIGGNKFDSPMEAQMQQAWDVGARAERAQIYLA